MPEGFDKTLQEFANEANQSVDFDALKERILKAHEAEKTVLKPGFSPAKVRRWGLLAACLVLFIAAGSIALRGSMGAKGDSAAPQPMMLAAAEAAPKESAAEESVMDETVVAEPAAEAPAAAMAPEPAAASFEIASATEVTGAAGADANGRVADSPYDPYALLVNRSNPLPDAGEAANLSSVDEAGLENIKLKKNGMRAEATALSALGEMLRAAEAEGVTGFYLVSAYRSYDEQSAIWQRKISADPEYGQNGQPVASMPPGESEHQTGLAFDITSLGHPSMSEGYADTEQAQWLAANCARFGFILRYPKGKEDITGVVFEPWHFRYVGADRASYLTQCGLVLEEGEN